MKDLRKTSNLYQRHRLNAYGKEFDELHHHHWHTGFGTGGGDGPSHFLFTKYLLLLMDKDTYEHL